MSNSCLQNIGIFARRNFKKFLFTCCKKTPKEGRYDQDDSLDQQELVGLMDENIDHPFDEDIKVIVHKCRQEGNGVQDND
jgi:uncharacterized membrane protein YcjF (UPF0283 family)